uniref:Insulin-like growth factor-binding protein 2 n=1 Tax=Oryctolagus cuniculus TaxID=9986 RepID=A0A5F9CFY4_RABIT
MEGAQTKSLQTELKDRRQKLCSSPTPILTKPARDSYLLEACELGAGGKRDRGLTEPGALAGWARGRARTHKSASAGVPGEGEGVVSKRGRGESRGRGEAGFLGPGCGSRGGDRSGLPGPCHLPARSLAAVAIPTANMLPRPGGSALPLLLPPPPLLLLLLLLLGAGGGGCGRGARAEVLFRCPPCTPERLAACGPPPTEPCAELVREPGCGCCSVCARLEGEACGVYAPRCAHGLRCYPNPDTELPLRALVHGQATCQKLQDASPQQVADNADDHSEGTLVENNVDGTMNVLGVGVGVGRKALKTGMKELAVFREKIAEQHRQLGKGGKHHLGLEEPKKLWPLSARTLCQQELDQVLERISTMRLPDDRGPLENLYALQIPNCDKHGLYNLKQCKMSLNGQRGEAWCVAFFCLLPLNFVFVVSKAPEALTPHPLMIWFEG